MTARVDRGGRRAALADLLAMIVGELVPKSLALQYPTRTALVTVLPMQWSLRLFSWSIAVLNGSGALLLRAAARAVDRPPPRALARGDRAAHRREPRRRTARAAGTGPAAPRAAARPAHGAPADGAARAARGDRHRDAVRRGAPIVATQPVQPPAVYRGTLDHIVGMLHTKDVVTTSACGRTWRRCCADLRVRHDARRSAARVPARARSHQALVVDDGCRRLITLEDVSRAAGGVRTNSSAQLGRCAADGRVRCRAMRLEQAASHRTWLATRPSVDSSRRWPCRAGEESRSTAWSRSRRRGGRIASAIVGQPSRRRTMIAFAIITALILLNAFFVAAEFAIVGAPRAAIDARAAAGRPAGAAVQRVLRRSAAPGSLHRDRAARDHRRQPWPRHVWRARPGRGDLQRARPHRRAGVARLARRRQRRRRRHPHLLPHRRRRNGAEVAGAAAGRAAGLLDHAADAVDQERALSVRGRR